MPPLVLSETSTYNTPTTTLSGGAGVTTNTNPAPLQNVQNYLNGNNGNYNPNTGVINLSQGQVMNVNPVPTSFNVTTSSNNGAGAATVTQYLFNESVLNAAKTTNGSGAASIVNTYNDGFSGKVYDQLFKTMNTGQGILMKGLTIQITGYTSGSQIASPFATLAFNVITANGMGSTIPVPIDFSEALRATNFQSGTLTILRPFFFNALSQVQLQLPKDTVISLTLFTQSSNAI